MLHCINCPHPTTMTREELFGKYVRLRDELNQAYAAPRWRSGHIDRLADEISEVERALSRGRAWQDDQTDEPLPGVAWSRPEIHGEA